MVRRGYALVMTSPGVRRAPDNWIEGNLVHVTANLEVDMRPAYDVCFCMLEK